MSNETNPIEQVETRIVREEPSPLVMTKTRTRKEDGRVLIYYEFSQPGKPESPPSPSRERAG